MLEESVRSVAPSIWASMSSWLTPTVLFVVLNLTIGTIVITSSLTSQKPNQNQQDHSNLPRSPSLLHRLKSIDFYSRKPTQLTDQQEYPSLVLRSPSMLQRLKSINLYNYYATTSPPEEARRHETLPEPEEEDGAGIGESQSIDEIYTQLRDGAHAHVSRSKSDTGPSGGEAPPARLPRKMKKSASAKSAFAHFEEADVVEARRPATVREVRVTEADDDGGDNDEEVDSKADDFINKFKQQLKLQRLESIIRYKDMIGRGAGK